MAFQFENMKIPNNPRMFSMRIAAVGALGVLATAVISICLEFGNGSFLAGLSYAANYLGFFGVVIVIMAAIGGVVALVSGRLIGTTVTAAILFCVLITSLVMSYIGSKPLARFRNVVWKEAPQSLTIYEHNMLTTFNDGTSYTFIIGCEPELVRDICQGGKLSTNSRDSTSSLLPILFPDTNFRTNADFYRGDGIELAYFPSEKKAFVVYSPSLANSASFHRDAASPGR